MTIDVCRNTKSVVIETYLCFVNHVVTPLKAVIEAGEVENEQVLSTLGNMKNLIAYLEQRYYFSSRDEEKDINIELTPPAHVGVEPSRDPSLLADSLPRNDPSALVVSSPLDSWIALVGKLASRQRSTAREIEILRTLEDAQENGVLLRQLQNRLISLSLADKEGQATIVTQISRLKKVGLVNSESQGLYSRTEGGAERLKKMRRNYEILFAPDEIRGSIPQVYF